MLQNNDTPATSEASKLGMWKRDKHSSDGERSQQKYRSNMRSPEPHNVSGSIAYTVVFDDSNGRMISTPTIKKRPSRVVTADTLSHSVVGVMNDDDEKLMAEIIEEVESKERREKLEEKLLIAEIMRDAQIQEKMEKARQSRKDKGNVLQTEIVPTDDESLSPEQMSSQQKSD